MNSLAGKASGPLKLLRSCFLRIFGSYYVGTLTCSRG